MVFCYIIFSVISDSTSKALPSHTGTSQRVCPSLVHMDVPDGQRHASLVLAVFFSSQMVL